MPSPLMLDLTHPTPRASASLPEHAAALDVTRAHRAPEVVPPNFQLRPVGVSKRLTRASLLCGALALAALVLSGLYGSIYSLRPTWQSWLADVPALASTLSAGFLALALLMACWSVGLLILSGSQGPALLRSGRAFAQRLSPARWWGLLFGLAAVYAVVHIGANPTAGRAPLDALTYGTAELPFQYRLLFPILARGVTAVVPDPSLTLVYGMFDALSAVGAVLAFGLLLSLFVEDPRVRRLLSLALFFALFFNLAAPYRHAALFFPYDTPSVAFFALGLYLIHTKRWSLYYPLFVIATLNRETSCFLTICYALAYLRTDGLARVAMHALAQAAIWLAIKGVLYAVFLHNPAPGSSAASSAFFDTTGTSLTVLTSPVGLLYITLALGGLWVVVLSLWPLMREDLVRRSFLFVPVFLIGMFFVGDLMEVRIYSELIPLFTLAFVLILRHILRAEAHNEGVGAGHPANTNPDQPAFAHV